MSENTKVDALTVASPVMAAVAALFMSGCVALAHLMVASSAGAKGQLLLKAGLLTFALGEAVALVLGILGVIRVRRRDDLKGLPEALLGILSVGLLVLSAIVLLLPAAAP